MRSPPAFFVRCTEAVASPCCGEKLMPIGTRARKYRNSLSEQLTLRIRRLRCKCGKIHHELPDILVPYKRYEAACIEKVVSEPKGSATIALDESTICRWKAWFRERIAHWIGGLVSIAIRFKLPVEVRSLPSQSVHQRIGHLVGHADGWLKRIVRPVVNANLWGYTRSACTATSVSCRL